MDKSCAPWIARLKGFEAVVRAPDDRMTVGPTDDIQGSGYKGWVRYHEMAFAGSAQSESEDLLAALLMSLPQTHLQPTLHHVGFAYATLDEMVAAVEANEAETGHRATWPGASDLIRAYTWRSKPDHINDGYWVERIFRPSADGTSEASAHVDLVSSDPHGVLNFVAEHLGDEPQIFNPGWENGPLGYVFVMGRDMPVGVMTRGHWWNIPMVPRPGNLQEVVEAILDS